MEHTIAEVGKFANRQSRGSVRQQFEQLKSVAGELPMVAGFRDEAGGFAVWRRAGFMPKSALQQCEEGVRRV